MNRLYRSSAYVAPLPNRAYLTLLCFVQICLLSLRKTSDTLGMLYAIPPYILEVVRMKVTKVKKVNTLLI